MFWSFSVLFLWVRICFLTHWAPYWVLSISETKTAITDVCCEVYYELLAAPVSPNPIYMSHVWWVFKISALLHSTISSPECWLANRKAGNTELNIKCPPTISPQHIVHIRCLCSWYINDFPEKTMKSTNRFFLGVNKVRGNVILLLIQFKQKSRGKVICLHNFITGYFPFKGMLIRPQRSCLSRPVLFCQT